MRFPVTLVNEITPKSRRMSLDADPKNSAPGRAAGRSGGKRKKFVAEVLVGRTENADS
jgi:hypothetical protein